MMNDVGLGPENRWNYFPPFWTAIGLRYPAGGRAREPPFVETNSKPRKLI